MSRYQRGSGNLVFIAIAARHGSGTVPAAMDISGFCTNTFDNSCSILFSEGNSICIHVSNINLNRRHLGDNFDEDIQQRHQSFVVTVDNRFIISTGYWDKPELSVVLSGSEHSLTLQHTLNGDILCSFENPSIMPTPRLLSPLFDGDIIVYYGRLKLYLYTLHEKLMRQAIFEDETVQNMVLNADSQYTVIDDDRGFVQIIRAHDLQPVYAYPQCDASIRSLSITRDQKHFIDNFKNKIYFFLV
ncbi:unnamed protein product [Rotaria magnacalcarata]|uniref:Uncharacterized protein n=3 Tax=Rotaria magnacalcarata TaxID=392030 RepID=A0A816SXA3_9BILA|nr:unnamed protein product [Rotaria magnacalcarata]